MKITTEEVRHVAHLARLTLNEMELEKITAQLDNILSYVEKLEELDTENVTPITRAFSITNAFREDMITPSLSKKEALANSPSEKNDSFVVPRVM